MTGPETFPSARTSLHVQLAALLLLPVAALLGWFLVLRARGARGREERIWWRLLAGLAAADTAVALFVVAVAAGVVPELAEPGARYVLGVQLDPDAQGGARIEEVLEGSPADGAGLRAGDVVLRFDGQAVRSAEELVAQVRAARGEEPLALELRRDGSAIDVVVRLARAPVTGDGAAADGARRISPAELGEAAARAAPYMLPFGLALLALLAFGLARGMDGVVPLCAWFLATVVGAAVAGALTALAAQALVDLAPAAWSLLEMTVGVAWLLALGLAGATLFGPGLRGATGVRHGSTFALGTFYTAALFPRAIALGLLATWLLSSAGVEIATHSPVELIEGEGTGAAALAVFLLLAVLFGPLAEELILRGALLPYLQARLGAVHAVWISSILFGLLHGHYGPLLLGPLAIGLVLGWARVRTGGLLVPFALHACTNGALLGLHFLL